MLRSRKAPIKFQLITSYKTIFFLQTTCTKYCLYQNELYNRPMLPATHGVILNSFQDLPCVPIHPPQMLKYGDSYRYQHDTVDDNCVSL